MSSWPKHHVTRTQLGFLLGGRATFRLSAWISGVALLALWGSDRFAPYATAMGVTGWLITVSASGTEKAALALLPRHGGADLRRFFVRLAMIPVGLSIVVCSVVLAAIGSSALLPAAVYSTSIGALSVLVALLRLHGVAAWDTAAFATIGLAHLGVILVAHVSGIGPVGVLWALAATTVIVVLLVLIPVLRSGHTPTQGSPPRRLQVLETVALMGGVEILNTIGVAVVYVLLRVHSPPGETSLMYVLILVSQAFTGAFLYLLRLAVPDASIRGATDPRAAGRLAARLFGWTAAATSVVTVSCAVLAWYGPATGPVRIAALAAALVAGLLGFAGATYASMRLETRDRAGRHLATAAAVAGVLGVAAAAAVLVPRSGALGALTAMLLGTAVQSLAGWTWLRRQRPADEVTLAGAEPGAGASAGG